MLVRKRRHVLRQRSWIGEMGDLRLLMATFSELAEQRKSQLVNEMDEESRERYGLMASRYLGTDRGLIIVRQRGETISGNWAEVFDAIDRREIQSLEMDAEALFWGLPSPDELKLSMIVRGGVPYEPRISGRIVSVDSLWATLCKGRLEDLLMPRRARWEVLYSAWGNALFWIANVALVVLALSLVIARTQALELTYLGIPIAIALAFAIMDRETNRVFPPVEITAPDGVSVARARLTGYFVLVVVTIFLGGLINYLTG
jgi:hypothetical protein